MNTALLIFLCIFALYGIFTAAYDLLFRGIKPKTDSMHIFKTVITENLDNAEEYIRYFSARDDRNEKVLILCHRQDEESKTAARILEAQFDFVTVLTEDEYFERIDTAMKL